ncbi:MAG TPA: aminotransferase class V-fold PLP-dependent enzyme [Pyrinomonadaceae bacterium]|jgi:cysteine desulfurase|nr:aminotransferase class V-fold PLP-dependent enzyme [Pyrinomonadaceae bacterium]
MIYFDNNATTHLAPAVIEAMNAALQSYGNPSSAHAIGQASRKIIDDARESVADLLGARPAEIVFTSGGTEGDNWAIAGALDSQPERKHIITTSVEHEAVRKLCEKLETRGYDVTWLGVDETGSLDLDELRSALTERTAIVSIMMANNETGVVFPVAEAAAIVKENSNALFHVDGVNAAGKIPIDLKNTQIDLLSISAHKFHGPKGIGALYIREGLSLPSLFIGGGQESGRRAGTEAVHQIAGLGAAAKLVKDMTEMERIRGMRDRLETAILETIPNAFLNGTRDASKRLPNTSNISFENTNGEMILAALDDAGVCVSTGSACNDQNHQASAVLQAMNVPYSRAMGSIRFSLGRFNNADEVDAVLNTLPNIIENLRALAAEPRA